MKKSYLEAARVLVLDASLAVQDIKAMGLYEACIRIFNSRWTRRLWTLQEGSLAAPDSRLAFSFRDRAISLRYLTQKIVQLPTTNIGQKGVAMDTLTRIARFSAVSYEVDGKQHGDLGSIEAGPQNRSVSVPSDKPLLIANLLDLDVADILSGLIDINILSCKDTQFLYIDNIENIYEALKHSDSLLKLASMINVRCEEI